MRDTPQTVIHKRTEARIPAEGEGNRAAPQNDRPPARRRLAEPHHASESLAPAQSSSSSSSLPATSTSIAAVADAAESDLERELHAREKDLAKRERDLALRRREVELVEKERLLQLEKESRELELRKKEQALREEEAREKRVEEERQATANRARTAIKAKPATEAATGANARPAAEDRQQQWRGVAPHPHPLPHPHQLPAAYPYHQGDPRGGPGYMPAPLLFSPMKPLPLPDEQHPLPPLSRLSSDSQAFLDDDDEDGHSFDDNLSDDDDDVFHSVVMDSTTVSTSSRAPLALVAAAAAAAGSTAGGASGGAGATAGPSSAARSQTFHAGTSKNASFYSAVETASSLGTPGGASAATTLRGRRPPVSSSTPQSLQKQHSKRVSVSVSVSSSHSSASPKPSIRRRLAVAAKSPSQRRYERLVGGPLVAKVHRKAEATARALELAREKEMAQNRERQRAFAEATRSIHKDTLMHKEATATQTPRRMFPDDSAIGLHSGASMMTPAPPGHYPASSRRARSAGRLSSSVQTGDDGYRGIGLFAASPHRPAQQHHHHQQQQHPGGHRFSSLGSESSFAAMRSVTFSRGQGLDASGYGAELVGGWARGEEPASFRIPGREEFSLLATRPPSPGISELVPRRRDSPPLDPSEMDASERRAFAHWRRTVLARVFAALQLGCLAIPRARNFSYHTLARRALREWAAVIRAQVAKRRACLHALHHWAPYLFREIRGPAAAAARSMRGSITAGRLYVDVLVRPAFQALREYAQRKRDERALAAAAEQWHRRRTAGSAFDLWRDLYREASLERAGAAFRRSRLLEGCWRLWRLGAEVAEAAGKHHQLQVLSGAFGAWRKALAREEANAQALAAARASFRGRTLRSVLTLWRRVTAEAEAERAAAAHDRLRSLAGALRLWRARAAEETRDRALERRADALAKRTLLRRWAQAASRARTGKEHEVAAAQMDRYLTAKRAFFGLRSVVRTLRFLKERSAAVEALNGRRLASLALRTWHAAYLVSYHERRNQYIATVHCNRTSALRALRGWRSAAREDRLERTRNESLSRTLSHALQRRRRRGRAGPTGDLETSTSSSLYLAGAEQADESMATSASFFSSPASSPARSQASRSFAVTTHREIVDRVGGGVWHQQAAAGPASSGTLAVLPLADRYAERSVLSRALKAWRLLAAERSLEREAAEDRARAEVEARRQAKHELLLWAFEQWREFARRAAQRSAEIASRTMLSGYAREMERVARVFAAWREYARSSPSFYGAIEPGSAEELAERYNERRVTAWALRQLRAGARRSRMERGLLRRRKETVVFALKEFHERKVLADMFLRDRWLPRVFARWRQATMLRRPDLDPAGWQRHTDRMERLAAIDEALQTDLPPAAATPHRHDPNLRGMYPVHGVTPSGAANRSVHRSHHVLPSPIKKPVISSPSPAARAPPPAAPAAPPHNHEDPVTEYVSILTELLHPDGQLARAKREEEQHGKKRGGKVVTAAAASSSSSSSSRQSHQQQQQQRLPKRVGGGPAVVPLESVNTSVYTRTLAQRYAVARKTRDSTAPSGGGGGGGGGGARTIRGGGGGGHTTTTTTTTTTSAAALPPHSKRAVASRHILFDGADHQEVRDEDSVVRSFLGTSIDLDLGPSSDTDTGVSSILGHGTTVKEVAKGITDEILRHINKKSTEASARDRDDA
jgi:hypothetical protein